MCKCWTAEPARLCFIHVVAVAAPLVEKLGHVIGKRCLEVHLPAGLGMHEAENSGVQSLARTDLETVLYELTVLGVDGSLADFRAAVTLVIEERMADG